LNKRHARMGRRSLIPVQQAGLLSALAVAPAVHTMTSQGTAHGRFQRAIHRGHVEAAEMAAREMGGLSLADSPGPFSFPKPERVRGACLLKMNPG
jgi:hypothetical protein